MLKLLKNLWTRIKIDWIEYWEYKKSIWNIKRDNRAIDRAFETAQLKNSKDSRTYYILRNLAGGFDAVSSHDLAFLRRYKIVRFTKYHNYAHMLSQSFGMVTSNKISRHNYTVTMKRIMEEENNETDE